MKLCVAKGRSQEGSSVFLFVCFHFEGTLSTFSILTGPLPNCLSARLTPHSSGAGPNQIFKRNGIVGQGLRTTHFLGRFLGDFVTWCWVHDGNGSVGYGKFIITT